MIRILHMIGNLDAGGSQMMLLNIYKKIDRNKVQFDFIVDHPEKLFLAKEVEKLGGKIFFMPTFTGFNISEIKNNWNSFLSKNQEYKIFHMHVRSSAFIYLPIAKKHGCITIAHSHSTSNGTGISSLYKDLLCIPIKRQADWLFACSDKAGKWLFGSKSIMQSNYKVIPNSIDASKFQYNAQLREKIRSELGLKNELVIGTVGRLTKPKNQFFLIELFFEVHNRYSDSRLVIVGDGKLKTELIKKCEELRIRDLVYFVGNKANVEVYLQAMDVFVFPSLWEGLGISVIEAQASGLPCIISDTIPKEVDINAGLISFLSLDSDIDSWCDEILRKNNFVRDDQVSNIKRANYDIEHNAIKIENFYLNLIETARR